MHAYIYAMPRHASYALLAAMIFYAAISERYFIALRYA